MRLCMHGALWSKGALRSGSLGIATRMVVDNSTCSPGSAPCTGKCCIASRSDSKRFLRTHRPFTLPPLLNAWRGYNRESIESVRSTFFPAASSRVSSRARLTGDDVGAAAADEATAAAAAAVVAVAMLGPAGAVADAARPWAAPLPMGSSSSTSPSHDDARPVVESNAVAAAARATAGVPPTPRPDAAAVTVVLRCAAPPRATAMTRFGAAAGLIGTTTALAYVTITSRPFVSTCVIRSVHGSARRS